MIIHNWLRRAEGWGLGGADAEFATAVLLVVEVVLVEELVAAVLEAGFAPVLWPEEGGGMRWHRIMLNGRGRGKERSDGLLGKEACLVDLVEVLPTGGGEGGGEVGNAELLGLECGGGETDAEALEAAGTAFGFVFKSLDLLEPCLVVVVTVYPWDVEAVGMTFAFVFADVVFFAWVDVGIEVEDGGVDVVLEHPLDNGGGAGGAACMEENTPFCSPC